MKLPEYEITVRRKRTTKSVELKNVSSVEDCHTICRAIWDEGTIDWIEEFVVVYLNRAHRVNGFLKVSKGGMTGTVADPRVILKAALDTFACAMILCHNHPSGALRPSAADEQLTQRVTECARFFDIKVLDHIILGEDDRYFSFADEGLL